MMVIFLLIFGYVFGSIPFAVVVSKLRGVNILEVGTHNPGAANVYREIGKKYGIIVWALDTLKGLVPMTIASFLNQPLIVISSVGALAIAGHCFSIFLKFRGGKGVATMGSVVVYLFPLLFPVGGVLYFFNQRTGRKPWIIFLSFLIFFMVAYTFYIAGIVTWHTRFFFKSHGLEVILSMFIFLLVATIANVSTIQEIKQERADNG
jgi:glycerol-3-phosphate acyltransferase PlsY